MKVLIDYNGWQKVEDIPPQEVQTGVIQLCIMPPLRVDCGPQCPPRSSSSINFIVYATGTRTEDGMLIFSNKM